MSHVVVVWQHIMGGKFKKNLSLQFGVFPLEDHEVLNSSDSAIMQAPTEEERR